MYGFFFDNSRCTGCRTCEMACVDFNNLSVGRRYRRVIDYEGGSCELAADGTAKTTAFATTYRLRAITAPIPNAFTCALRVPCIKTNSAWYVSTRINASVADIAPSRVRIMPRPSILKRIKAQSAMGVRAAWSRASVPYAWKRALCVRSTSARWTTCLRATLAQRAMWCRCLLRNTRTRICI